LGFKAGISQIQVHTALLLYHPAWQNHCAEYRVNTQLNSRGCIVVSDKVLSMH